MTTRAKKSKTAKRRAKPRPPSTCVHAICRDCYRTKPNIREPIVLHVPHCIADHCCYCGSYTKAGFYYRDKARLPAVQRWFGGSLVRCNCATGRKHPRYPTGYKAMIGGYYQGTDGPLHAWVRLEPDGHLT